MADPNIVPMGTYTSVTGVVDGTAQTEITALFTTLLGYIPNIDAANPAGEIPNYDQWHPVVARNLRAELIALQAAITAAPAS